MKGLKKLSDASNSKVAVAALSFVFGLVTTTGSYVMMVIPKTRKLQRVLVHIFRVYPSFLLGASAA